ncbi:hypothetical protein GUA87_05155 [Sneathiella sp. P13V-1]|uniref:hypothetical protein n=1 Tax=Sneathiella sp. P13V-1 TaxID=2697366 RepID=UPI00187B49E5|nr:hypothetical protein [Sneathiella sp. P13V-1]MBE7636221.1 hypothetical protein [Sneathiella sp. P13V-1]
MAHTGRLIAAFVFASAVSFPAAAEQGFEELFSLNGPLRAMGVDKVYDDIILRPEELKKCLNLAKKLDKDTKALDVEFARLQTEADNLAALGEEVDISNEYLEKNPTKTFNDDEAIKARAEKVERHNQLTNEYNEWIIKYQKDQEAYADMADQFDNDQQTFIDTCSKKQYYAEDLKALQSK